MTPVAINSKVVSAQSRGREYWTNISFTQPVNKCITVKDVLDNYSGNAISADDTTKQLNTLLSTSKYSDNYSWCYDTTWKNSSDDTDGLKIQRIGRIAFGQHQTEIVTCVTTPYVFDGKIIRKVTPEECEKLQTVPVGYTSCVSDSTTLQDAWQWLDSGCYCTYLQRNVIYNSKIYYFPLAMCKISVVSSYTLPRGNIVIFVLINSKKSGMF